MDTPVIDAYTTNAILGGMTIAIELEVAISAVENGAENPPRSIIAGISTIPSAATVAGPEPEIAPKKQATITHTIAIPPLVCPTQVSTKRISRLEIPAFAMMLPDNTKNGIASNRNLLIPEYMLVATIVSEVPEYRIAQIDDNPRQIPIGIPRIRNTKNGESRLENIEELRNKIVAYEESCEAEDEKSTLSGFLEQVALVADIDSLDEETDYVVLMTLHSAKGLEFPHVYLAGLEDGIFPSYMTITADDPAELEEERRLCYVGITRAKENLTLTCARRRMVHGETQYNKMSRFLKEIPLSLLSTGALFKKEQTEEEPKVSAYRQAKQAFATKAFAATKPAQQFTVTKGKGPGYDVGDRVRHIKFGEGLVTQITEGGRDYEVTVDFDTAGTKKMFAMFAKLQKID